MATRCRHNSRCYLILAKHSFTYLVISQTSFGSRGGVTLVSWDQRFDPIKLPARKSLVTLHAAEYVTELPKAERDADEWQAAMPVLLLVAEHDEACDVRSHRRDARISRKRDRHRTGKRQRPTGLFDRSRSWFLYSAFAEAFLAFRRITFAARLHWLIDFL